MTSSFVFANHLPIFCHLDINRSLVYTVNPTNNTANTVTVSFVTVLERDNGYSVGTASFIKYHWKQSVEYFTKKILPIPSD